MIYGRDEGVAAAYECDPGRAAQRVKNTNCQLTQQNRGITIEAMESGWAGVTEGGGMAYKDDAL